MFSFCCSFLINLNKKTIKSPDVRSADSQIFQTSSRGCRDVSFSNHHFCNWGAGPGCWGGLSLVLPCAGEWPGSARPAVRGSPPGAPLQPLKYLRTKSGGVPLHPAPRLQEFDSRVEERGLPPGHGEFASSRFSAASGKCTRTRSPRIILFSFKLKFWFVYLPFAVHHTCTGLGQNGPKWNISLISIKMFSCKSKIF